MVKKDLARATSIYLDKVLKDEDVLAVTGGTTLAEVARSLPLFSSRRRVIVVPARGGLGEEVELQANTIAAVFARQLGGSYRLFHLPDDLSEEAMHTISNEPKVRRSAPAAQSRLRPPWHGRGEMARRRALAHGRWSYPQTPGSGRLSATTSTVGDGSSTRLAVLDCGRGPARHRRSHRRGREETRRRPLWQCCRRSTNMFANR